MPFFQDIATIAFYFGLSITTSAGIFGFLYAIQARKESFFLDHWKALTVANLALLMLGAMLTIVAWFLAAIFHPFVSFAQEGVPFVMSQEVEVSILRWQAFGAVVLCIFAVFGFFPLRYRSATTWIRFERYYAGIVLAGVTTLLMPVFITQDAFGAFLSIYRISGTFTIGTIFSASFMYILFRTAHRHLAVVKQVFGLHRKLFWLGMTVSSISFVFLGPRLFGATSNFILSQTILGISIILIAVLGGPVLRLFERPVDEKTHEFLHLIATLFIGAISISWIFVTIINGLEFIDIPLRQLFILYGALLTSGLTILVFIEYFLQKQKHLI